MSIKSLYLFFFILLSFCAKAQNDVSIVNTCGFNLQTSNYMFDISIGEPFIYAIEDASSIFTCGYIQPEIAAVNGIKHEQNTDQVNVYPNPFSEVLYIQTTLNNLNCCVYDMLGRMVFEGKCTQAINLSFLSKGIYTLSIYDQYNQVMTNIKVCKSNE